MTTQILTTKLFIPSPGQNQVSRPRLLDHLQRGSASKLTLISAPAGYGKTSLLSEWISQGEIPFCWLSLDQQDNDLKSFLAYIIASLQSIRIEVDEQILNLHRSSQSDHFTTILIPLINQISDADRRFALVLDDYHLIQNPEDHEALIYLLDNLPPKMRLVIATRTDPPLRLAQLRARGELCEIRAEDLRFTVEEAIRFLNQNMELGLSTSDVVTLTEKTEGWVAGLQLAAISLGKLKDKNGFVTAFAGDDRYIADYLLDEALNQQPEHIRNFLLKTSLLNRLSPSLCDAVTGQKASLAILAELERANLFLQPLDNQRNWYRYHHLFADLLQVRLKQMMVDEVPELNSRISEWYEDNGLLSQAASYALKGGDLKRVSLLVERNTFTLVDTKELSGLVKQLDMLTDEEFRVDPWIVLAKAWAWAFTGKFDRVRHLLPQIEGRFSEFEEVDRRLIQGRILTLKAYSISGTGDKTTCIELAQQALELLPEDDVVMRGFTLSLMGNAYRDCGNLLSAVDLLKKAADLARSADDSSMAVLILCRLVAVQIMIGRLGQAETTCLEALEINDEYYRRTGRKLPVSALAQFRMGRILSEKNDLERAISCVQEGLSLSKTWGHYDVILLGLRINIEILQAIGDKEGALDVCKKRSQICERVLSKSNQLGYLEAEIRLSFGELEWVGDWIRFNGLDIKDEIRYQDCFLYFILLRLLIAQGQLDESEYLLNMLLNLVEKAGAVHRLIQLKAMQAVICHEKGDLDDALAILEQVLSLAEPEGFVRVFINQGEPMARLLYQASIQGIYAAYCNQLLAQFSKSAETDVSPRGDLVEPLSDREIEVLKSISQGSTNQEIAQELILSLHTVKSHARNIYSKLGVKNRTEAVARARLLGLLPQD